MLGSVGILVLAIILFSNFLTWAEQRPGFPFDDPVLSYLQPRNFSKIIFLLTYGTVIFVIIWKSKKPWMLVQLLQLYFLLLVVRTISIYLVPLYAPDTMISLDDPVLDSVVYKVHNVRDLFFSGHTATLFIFAFTLRNKTVKILVILTACVLGLLLMWQHVHYSIDVFAAPLFAWLVYWGHKKLNPKLATISREIQG